ncbi:MAG: substrate-binding domain-containing protein [Proteobacteria bacterium]|nr:substrate-binding domain-containing protein [Pseudomonadota bacterium]MBU1639910.1 substrate-binding domain-containing protein [Pseudomonadota bacterium]
MILCKRLSILVIILSLAGCSTPQEKEKIENCLLIYCGITMRHPLQEIATVFEKKHGCRVAIIQGGSEDLYQSLKLSRKGDLYLPGSPTYREKYLAEGFLGDYVYVGDNQAALIVQKGNPKNISADIKNLANQRYTVVIGNPESGSIGQHTKKILEKAGIYDEVLRNSVSLPAASRNIRRSIVEDGIDLAMNWRATASFPENKELMDALVLPESIAPKKKLLLNLLSFSDNPELAKEFMLLAVSPEGQAVFKKYSFLDEITVQGSLQR